MEPVVGVVPWLASLEESVERSVLKLALDSLRKSLRLRKDGAMADVRWWPETCPQGFLSQETPSEAARVLFKARTARLSDKVVSPLQLCYPGKSGWQRVVGGSAARLADCCSLFVVQP